MKNATIWATALTLICASTHALGDDQQDEARVHYTQGVDLYKDGKFEQASIAFERAYEIAPSYKILWNIGQVQNELGHYAAALDAYRRYLADGGDEVPAERRAEAEAEIERLTALVGEIVIDTEVEGATVFVDEKRQGDTPLDGPVLADIGEHEVLVKVGGDEIHREVVRVAGGKAVVVAVRAQSDGASGEPAVAAEDTGAGRTWTWVALGVGAAAGITGGVLGGVALSKKSDIEGDCVDKSCPPSSKSEADKVETLALTADVLYGVAAAFVITGVVLFFVEPGLESDGDVAVAPVVSTDVAGVAVTGRF